MEYQGLTLERLEHDTVRITTKDNKYIYFDPYKLPSEGALPKADVIFITHTHFDHCSVEDLKKIIQKSTVIIAVPDAQSKLADMEVAEVKLVKPKDEFSVGNLKVQVLPAYNPDKPFHPKEHEWVGYLVEADGVKVYMAGDTDLIPEMNDFPEMDVAFLPVSGTYVMTAEEAANAAAILEPKLAIPMHYGSVVGSESDAQHFVTEVKAKGMDAHIL
ncbi:MAG: MBL fold metallo-hydrolase [Candidatus Woesearchaeota archaeon]